MGSICLGFSLVKKNSELVCKKKKKKRGGNRVKLKLACNHYISLSYFMLLLG